MAPGAAASRLKRKTDETLESRLQSIQRELAAVRARIDSSQIPQIPSIPQNRHPSIQPIELSESDDQPTDCGEPSVQNNTSKADDDQPGDRPNIQNNTSQLDIKICRTNINSSLTTEHPAAAPKNGSPIKEIIDLDPDVPVPKNLIRNFVSVFYPVLKDIPDWVSGACQKFEGDSVRLCTSCDSLCEWIYFLVENSKETKELCAPCVVAQGYRDSAKTFIREGVIEYLNALNSTALGLFPDGQA